MLLVVVGVTVLDAASEQCCGALTYAVVGMEVPPPHVVLTVISERLLSCHSEMIHIRASCLSFYSQLLQGCLASEDSRCSCAFVGAGRNEPVDIV